MALEISIHYSDSATDPANKQPLVVFPGETNTTSTSLSLVGQGTVNYGKHIMEDFIRLLENFCSDSEPSSPTKGQLWYNNIDETLKVAHSVDYETKKAVWKTVGGVHVSNEEPVDKSVLWYDTSNPNPQEWQLKLYRVDTRTPAQLAGAPNLTGWVSVADRYVKKTGDIMTGSITYTLNETGITATVNNAVNTITPNTTSGPAMLGDRGATVIINRGYTAPNNSRFVVGAGQVFADATAGDSRLFTVIDSGNVIIHRGTLDVSNNKIIKVANGTANGDAVNFSQLDSLRSSTQTKIDAMTSSISANLAAINGKVSRSGDTMTGALRINSSLNVGQQTTLEGGLNVSGGTVTLTPTVTMSGAASVGGNLTVTGGTSLTSTLTVGSTAQLNSTLTVTGITQLRSTLTVSGAATFQNNISTTGSLSVQGNTSLTGLATMNQTVAAIGTNNKNLVTKEYVDSRVTSIPTPRVPRAIWVDRSTLASVRSTFTSLTDYPYGSTVTYRYSHTESWNWGNGTSTGTYTKTMTAVRTETAGWVEVIPSGALTVRKNL